MSSSWTTSQKYEQWFRTILKKRSLSTLTAPGQCALRRLLAHREPRLILLDLQLGTADGYDFLRSIRSTSDVPMIVMTGRHVEEIDRI
jgi:two-component system, OmpR family, response regulator